jgi:hypothetical protein
LVIVAAALVFVMSSEVETSQLFLN